jgi:hypothetical protein
MQTGADLTTHDPGIAYQTDNNIQRDIIEDTSRAHHN